VSALLDLLGADVLADVRTAAVPPLRGRVRGVLGLSVVVGGLPLALGDAVVLHAPGREVLAEVVSLAERDGTPTATCMPIEDATGVRTGTPVESLGGPLEISVGPALLGRVLDGLGRPLDGSPLPEGLERVRVDGRPPHPLTRQRITRQLGLGVRCLDAFTPCGVGQRLGLFAGSGVGKSSLLSMIARGTEADVVVLCLVGERGREVREFLEDDLGAEGLARAVVVISTSDEPALARLKAAFTATRIAEHFRDQGLDVVLMMDSLTRVATAQREVGLSAGEPPATRGFPPSAFAVLPKLLERAGQSDVGSITALYTVLVEGGDHDEPVADSARSLLDGHVVLSRDLATTGHFPSVDVLESVSRLTGAVTTPAQRGDAARLRALLAAHRDAKDLVEIGAYAPGSNPLVDRALALRPHLDAFLRQATDDVTPLELTWTRLAELAVHA
jgi:flagellum-specific ATP synthase